MLQRRKDQLTFQSSGEASSIDFIDCATNRIGQARDSQGCENISPRPIQTKTEIHFLLPPRNRSQSLHNPLHPSRTRMLSTILDWVPPSLELEKKPFEDPLKKGVRTFLWKHGMFFECNTSCSIILCLFVPFTDEKWRYFGR